MSEYLDCLRELTTTALAKGAQNLSQLLGSPVEFSEAAIVDGIPGAGELGEQMVSVTVAFTEGFDGETALVLTEADAKGIVAGMTAGMAIDPDDMLGELGLSALGEAMNQFVAGIGIGLGQIKGELVDISPPTVKIWTKTENPHAADPRCHVLEWRGQIAGTAGSLYWTVLPELADDLVAASRPDLVAPKAAPLPVTSEQQATLLEITTAAIARGAENLTQLIGTDVAFDHGTFYDITPLAGKVGEQMVSVSVHFTEGLVGQTSLVFTEGEARRIVALMVEGMGVPEDEYLGEIGMSALGEAMNQFVAGIGIGLAEIKGELVDISTPTVKLWTMREGVRAKGSDDGHVIGWTGHIGDTDGSLYWSVAPELADALVPRSTPPADPDTPAVAAAAAPVAPTPTSLEALAPVATGAATTQQLGRLADVNLDVTVELGRSQIPVRELLALDEGGVIRLGRPVGEPVDLLVNGLRTARGEIVVVDGRLGLRVTELIA